jgi:hypothetical protein
MHIVVATEPGVLEFNWSWAPTWLGMNHSLKEEIEKELRGLIEGRPLDPEIAHQLVLSFLSHRFPSIGGLFEYLDGLKFVEIR